MRFKRLESLQFHILGLSEDQGLPQMANDLESCLLAKGLAWGHMKWPNLTEILLWDNRSLTWISPGIVKLKEMCI